MAHFSLTEFMEEVITEAITLAPAHLVQYESCAEATLYGDREKLSQVMTNLLGNAGKYSPEGTTILLKCQLVGKQVQFNVIDEGMGIAPDDKVHLFERYYRVKDTERSSVKGFGIGLYLVAEILKLHGSEIKVESELGKGSTFSFSLIPAPVLA